MTEDLHRLVRDEFSAVRLDEPLGAVTARGRRWRRRRFTGGTLVVASVLAAAGLWPVLAPGPAEPAPMRLAAWSVEPEPDGTVRLTVRQLTDAEGLTAALREAGVPALVEFEEVAPGHPAGCADDGRTGQPGLLDVMPRPEAGEQVYTLRRDRIPPGMSLHFVMFAERDTAGNWSTSLHTSMVRGEPVPCRPLDKPAG
ncbi:MULTISPECIES: hypothetical protein [Catenuloplanes]|uniref:Uncharacterized protein n=1 Tax=Catenuloplanes niger TaxID=587534 RepID=A0AAE3ZKJ6_9ACTN|nr:hypothetical protein [Catenuloplanes niger]MDR7320941.1 hypothetical protein [Catenuloplanes niger]